MNPAEDYILKQHEPFKTMLLHLQVLVETTIPEVTLLYKWKIPFYYVDKYPICYFNVAKKGYLDVGFWSAKYFTTHADKMIADKRKFIKSLRYTTLDQIDDQVFIEIIQQAYTYRKEKVIDR
ncbi:DUF1801 domain-containing protein [Aquimarina sp. 2201CG1-2-11]|uniref:DUF1801 domain-containing protein n=1 Tax=Aquimarina discodermiae TaxID=3231043 RepID=UPI0034624926